MHFCQNLPMDACVGRQRLAKAFIFNKSVYQKGDFAAIEVIFDMHYCFDSLLLHTHAHTLNCRLSRLSFLYLFTNIRILYYDDVCWISQSVVNATMSTMRILHNIQYHCVIETLCSSMHSRPPPPMHCKYASVIYLKRNRIYPMHRIFFEH